MGYLILFGIGLAIYFLFRYGSLGGNGDLLGNDAPKSERSCTKELTVNNDLDRILDSLPLHDGECEAYLDVETTSFSPKHGDLTVVGICLDYGNEYKTVQLVGDEITSVKLAKVIENVKVLYTYNGSRFDLPYIKAKLGLDLTEHCQHKDLMYECWKRNLYGGLKKVEKKLGIRRQFVGVDGKVAVDLWYKYKIYEDNESLKLLLKYNEEDVLNLRALRQRLNV